MNNKMFCFQCQECAGGNGCTICGVCGKSAAVAGLQDLLVHAVKGLSAVAVRRREEGGRVTKTVNHLVTASLFMTVTNANFDSSAIRRAVTRVLDVQRELVEELNSREGLPEAALWDGDEDEYVVKAASVGVLSTADPDIRSLRSLITYGLKGLCAYVKHANALHLDSEEIDIFIQEALAKTLDDDLDAAALTALALETGKFGVAGMALLDRANTNTYGHPEITEV
ncbi:MAG: hypothetical protein J6S21_05410, partial [Victivallales bacterium]|nr:hypothetical protein [Victivallales bacterium]